MSPIGRIFSVINLVLAALFLGWASVNLATSQEYKAKFEAEQTAKGELETRLNAELQGVRTELTTAREALSQTNDELSDAKSEAERVNRELTVAKTENTQFGANLGKLAQEQESLQGQLQTQTGLATQAQTDKAEADSARDAALDAQQAAETALATAQAEIAALQNTQSDLEKQLNTSGEMIASLEVQLEQLQVLTGASLSDIIPQKKINGTVVQALYDVPPGLVAINRGSNDGVMRGYTFEISNGTQYKGQVRVENVREDMCTCIILRTQPGQVIGQGDRADTVL